MMSEAQLPDATANDTAAAPTDKARSESFSSAGGTHNNSGAQTQHLNENGGNNTTNYPTENSGEGSSMTAAAGGGGGGTAMTRAAVSSSTSTHSQSQVMSAPMSVLGANSDRNDYYHRHNSNSSPSNNNDDGSSSADNSSSGNNNTLGKVKAWFASGDNTSADNDHNTAHDYREFSTPSNNKQAQKKYMNSNNNNKNNNDNDGDVELQQQSQYHRNTEKEEEERVIMEKCSFAYGESSPDKYKSSHRIPSIDPHYSNKESDDEHYNSRNSKNNGNATNPNNGEYNDEENQEYFGRNYYQNNRRISPSAVAHALTSRAKRTWTERRYRRRLRQSQFIPPNTTTTGYTAGHDDSNGQSHTSSSSLPSIPTEPPASFHYELTSEHRHAFLAAHAALNSKLPNEQYRNRHANLRLDGHRATTSSSVNNNDLQFDIDGVDGTNDDEEELRADLTKSSLAIRGGLIRLPTDNVRLVCDARLQPGILSIETRDVGGVHGTGTQGYEMFGNANRYGNIHGNMMMRMMNGGGGSSNSAAGDTDSNNTRQQSERMADSWKRHELAYVLTVDEHIYQRVAQEMGDSYRVPWGIYFCCRETEGGGNHVGIEAAVLILLVIFILLIAGMIAWPTS